MSRDADDRRRMSNAYFDRRQDRLDRMRSQQRRTRAVYEGLRTGDDIKVRSTLGIPSAAASHAVGETHAGRIRSLLEEVYRRREEVLEEIDALAHYSETQRRELRVRLALIDLWQRTVDEQLAAFETLVRARGAELREVAERLNSEIASVDSPLAAASLPSPWPAGNRPMDFWFGTGLGGIIHAIGMLPCLSEASRQAWIAELRRIDRARKNTPGVPGPLRLWPRHTPDLTPALRSVQAEIDSAGHCVGLLSGIALLRGACRRYRAL